MKNIVFSQAFFCLVAAVGLSSCTGNNANLSREQVDNSMKNAASTFHQAAEKTSESMKELGPKMQGAKEKAETMGPALDKAEQQVKSAGSELGKVGMKFGNAIDNTAKGIKQDFAAHAPTKSGPKTARK